MELRLLEYFLAVAREGSISAAARTLHISQPALSTQLKQLEKELGKQLLYRGTKGSKKVLLTEEGMILHKRAGEISALVQRTEDEITNAGNQLYGNIFIGAGESDVMRVLAHTAKLLQKKSPHIQYHISSGNTEYVLDYLDQGLIDFGLLFTKADEQKYNSICLPYTETWGVLMRRDAPLAEKDFISPEDLWDQPLIVSRQRANLAQLEDLLKRPASQLNIAATYNLLFNASLFAEEGLGYALCFSNIINTEGTALCFRPLAPRLESACYVVWKREQPLSKAANAFLKVLQEQFQQLEYNRL